MHDRLPDGPPVPELIQAVGYHRDPLGVLLRLRSRYGPVFTLRFPMKDPLVIADVPEGLAALLESDPSASHAGEARRTILPQASSHSPFGADGGAYADSHGRMMRVFAEDRVAGLEGAIRDVAELHVASWPVGRPFRLLEATRELCTDITVRFVLGVENERRRSELVRAVRRMLTTPGNPPLPLPGDGEGPGGTVGQLADRLFARRSSTVRRLLSDELDDRRADAHHRDDLLAAMITSDPPLTNEHIVDQVLIVIMAAQEPPGIALANVLYELAARPQVAEEFLAQPERRRAIVAEVIRLRPSAQAALRRLTVPMDLSGHVLPAGTVIACPSLLLHRDPRAFPDPGAFRPQRFEGGTPHGAPYLPFGGGARRCIGEALAHAEFRTVLPTVLERLRLRRAWPRVERMVVRATVLVPQRSALVTTRSR